MRIVTRLIARTVSLLWRRPVLICGPISNVQCQAPTVPLITQIRDAFMRSDMDNVLL